MKLKRKSAADDPYTLKLIIAALMLSHNEGRVGIPAETIEALKGGSMEIVLSPEGAVVTVSPPKIIRPKALVH